MNALTLHFQLSSQAPDFEPVDGLPFPETMAAASERADARVFLTNHEERIVAHAALWWKETPKHEGERVGAIGGFYATNDESAKILLEHAALRLGENGCHIAMGPMNGNTWRRHRFVVASEPRGPFFLEPRNPPVDPTWWRNAGFTELSHYTSSVVPLDGRRVVSAAMKARLENSGVVIRKLELACFEDELRRIHKLSLKSFSGNFLYTPLDEAEFLGAYGKVREHVEPDLVRIAERAGECCGFVFSIRDLEAEARGEKPAVIVKTLAVDPDSHCAGVGSLLVDEVHAAALRMGYLEAIHALEHETNTSQKITGRYGGRVFRNYALFSKRL